MTNDTAGPDRAAIPSTFGPAFLESWAAVLFSFFFASVHFQGPVNSFATVGVVN